MSNAGDFRVNAALFNRAQTWVTNYLNTSNVDGQSGCAPAFINSGTEFLTAYKAIHDQLWQRTFHCQAPALAEADQAVFFALLSQVPAELQAGVKADMAAAQGDGCGNFVALLQTVAPSGGCAQQFYMGCGMHADAVDFAAGRGVFACNN